MNRPPARTVALGRGSALAETRVDTSAITDVMPLLRIISNPWSPIVHTVLLSPSSGSVVAKRFGASVGPEGGVIDNDDDDDMPPLRDVPSLVRDAQAPYLVRDVPLLVRDTPPLVRDTLEPLVVREAPPIVRETEGPLVVRIHHPDYDEDEDTLLTLRALDDGGIDYDTTLAACAIVTGNTSDGFLTSTREALEPVARPVDGILRGTDYFFQLPQPDGHAREHPYPVVARFDDWIFPRRALPSPWREYRAPAAVNDATTSCRVSGCEWAVQKAHIVPVSLRDWCSSVGLSTYITPGLYSQNSIDAPGNIIRLRNDIHNVFDAKVFAVVPRRVYYPPTDEAGGGGGDGDISLVVHVVTPHPDAYFHQTFHNQKIRPFAASIECLYVRFAWTLFSPHVLGEFLDKCFSQRYLRIRDPETRKWTVEMRDPDQVRAMLAASRSRSASPRKRRAPGSADSNPSLVEYDDEPSTDGEDSTLADSEASSTESSPSRGRSRKRRRTDDGVGLEDGLVQKRVKVERGV
ncbi:hypothetical protein QBC39DRAFT_374571 [Podospora conica]|nr:hypothetical protein QBC39DRAFT_374571 [Schizothecium conicum]